MNWKKRIGGVILAVTIAAGGGYYAAGPHKTGHNHDGNSDASFVEQSGAYCTSAYALAHSGFCLKGDGSDSQGGRAPAYAKQPPIVPSNFSLDPWLQSKTSFPNSAAGGEAKFRTHCNWAFNAYEDPIVFPKQHGVSHLHTFFGNTGMNGDSTYESLRTTGNSTCGGGKINRSGYWYPSVLKDNALGDGKTMVIKPAYVVVYYNVPTSQVEMFSAIARGFTYVFGVNLSDPSDTAFKATIPSGFTYIDNGFAGWQCNASGTAYRYLRDASGNATFTCAAGTPVTAKLFGYGCWDGVNLTSPNGRKHVRPYIRHNSTSNSRVCPDGWYRIATFEMVISFDNPTGSSDYKNWYLSSDRIANSWTGSDCYGDGNGYAFCNGESMHADWFGAWDYDIMRTWMIHCNGTTIPSEADNPGLTPSDPHDCADTIYGDGRKGITGQNAPDGTRSPQLVLSLPHYTETTRFEPMPGAQ